MVINTNLTGAGGTPPAKSVGRHGSKTVKSSVNSSGAIAAAFNSQADSLTADAPSDIQQSEAARASVEFARTNLLRQPAMAMMAQANLSPETALRLLQD